MSLQTNLQNLATALGTDVKTLKTMINGNVADLTGLTTTAKNNLVAAVNEVKAQVNAIPAAPGAASEAAAGIIELATQAEVTTGTDDLRAITPLKLATRLSGIAAPASASTTVQGVIEIATLAEVATGTDTVRAVTAEGVRQERIALKAEILGAGVPAALDTLDELAAAIGDNASYAASITTALANRVRTDTAAQGLTGTEQSNARTNIAAVGTADIGNTETDLVATYNTAKA